MDLEQGQSFFEEVVETTVESAPTDDVDYLASPGLRGASPIVTTAPHMEPVTPSYRLVTSSPAVTRSPAIVPGIYEVTEQEEETVPAPGRTIQIVRDPVVRPEPRMYPEVVRPEAVTSLGQQRSRVVYVKPKVVKPPVVAPTPAAAVRRVVVVGPSRVASVPPNVSASGTVRRAQVVAPVSSASRRGGPQQRRLAPAGSDRAPSAAAPTLDLSDICARLAVVDGKERIVLYRRSVAAPAERPSTPQQQVPVLTGRQNSPVPEAGAVGPVATLPDPPASAAAPELALRPQSVGARVAEPAPTASVISLRIANGTFTPVSSAAAPAVRTLQPRLATEAAAPSPPPQPSAAPPPPASAADHELGLAEEVVVGEEDTESAPAAEDRLQAAVRAIFDTVEDEVGCREAADRAIDGIVESMEAAADQGAGQLAGAGFPMPADSYLADVLTDGVVTAHADPADAEKAWLASDAVGEAEKAPGPEARKAVEETGESEKSGVCGSGVEGERLGSDNAAPGESLEVMDVTGDDAEAGSLALSPDSAEVKLAGDTDVSTTAVASEPTAETGLKTAQAQVATETAAASVVSEPLEPAVTTVPPRTAPVEDSPQVEDPQSDAVSGTGSALPPEEDTPQVEDPPSDAVSGTGSALPPDTVATDAPPPPPRPPLSPPPPPPERQAASVGDQLVKDMVEACETPGLVWNQAGLTRLSVTKADAEVPQLCLNEFGLLELVGPRVSHVTSLPARVTSQAAVAAGGRWSDALTRCSVCGSRGAFSQFVGGGTCCGQVCLDSSRGHAKVRKRKRESLKKSVDTKAKDEDDEPLKKRKSVDSPDVKPVVKAADRQPVSLREGGVFSWSVYLSALGHLQPAAVPGPELGRPADPDATPFQPGHRLEAMDPRRPHAICACTVAEVAGSRLRLHFDGYSLRFDFWVEAGSDAIFPCGWTERRLAPADHVEPPRGILREEFTWEEYLRQKGARAAPEECFTELPDQYNIFSRVETEVQLGHRLEAADPDHPRHMRPAHVARVRGPRVLVMYDSLLEPAPQHGFWGTLNSPRLRPVAWGEENGLPPLPPPGWGSAPFSWQQYLVRTRSLPIPARLFRSGPACPLRPGMRLEAVDPRVPALVRPYRVEEVTRSGLVRLHTDGGDRRLDQWLPADSGLMHAPGWCRRTGALLTPPVVPAQTGECGTPECAGLGHRDGPRYRRHYTAEECPYRGEREPTPDRLSSELPEEKDLASLERPPRRASAQHTYTLHRNLSSLAEEVTASIFNSDPAGDAAGCWSRCASLRPVDRFLSEHRAVHQWTPATVLQFLRQFPPLQRHLDKLQTFADEEIDGESLLLLTREDLVSLLQLSLGAAVQVHACIVRLRRLFNYRDHRRSNFASPAVARANGPPRVN